MKTKNLKEFAKKFEGVMTPFGDLCGDILEDKNFPENESLENQFVYLDKKKEENPHIEEALDIFISIYNRSNGEIILKKEE